MMHPIDQMQLARKGLMWGVLICASVFLMKIVAFAYTHGLPE